MLCAVVYVSFAAVILVMVGLGWVAYGMDPHYSSKDGSRFLCNTQEFVGGRATDRKRETRVTIQADGALFVNQKTGLRRRVHYWTLVGVAPEQPKKGVAIYVAQRVADGDHVPTQLFMRIPTKSRVIPRLDALLAERELMRRGGAPGTAATAD
jgi:hypothetical protein